MLVLKSTHDKALLEIERLKGKVETLNQALQENAAEVQQLKEYKGVAEVQSIEALKKSFETLDIKINEKKSELKELLNKYYNYKTRINYSNELKSINSFVQKIEGHGSSKIKSLINDNKEQQKQLIMDGKAWIISGGITWNNSISQGKARQKRTAKFIFSAFNAEVDNIISLCKSTNLHTQYKKVLKQYSKSNKYGEDNFSKITKEFLLLRLKELSLVYKYHLQLDVEKENDRIHREQIAEENKVQKEIEKFVKKREKEERDTKKRIKDAEKMASELHDEQLIKMQQQIELLRSKLKDISEEKERALSMAQMTRSGYVYIISNRNSFGDDVYKIGMTRRLDPLDRVKELGDASVPFPFEIHGIIQSEDAPALENRLHKAFCDFRVNTQNFRKEFFKVSIEKIQEQVEQHHGSYDLLERMTIEDYDPDQLGV